MRHVAGALNPCLNQSAAVTSAAHAVTEADGATCLCEWTAGNGFDGLGSLITILCAAYASVIFLAAALDVRDHPPASAPPLELVTAPLHSSDLLGPLPAAPSAAPAPRTTSGRSTRSDAARPANGMAEALLDVVADVPSDHAPTAQQTASTRKQRVGAAAGALITATASVILVALAAR
jgi:hypothetical protein